ncbi:methyl-accepting chemotaxis protein [Marinospirillum alkaliphilum]|uniref:Methyl-accepting chemotaxis protein n=1 Tax=Marinospirillum alkaliphilum DSM 21637 TaxID=1122209 RepID=A0A1K1U392_9GAMM|nr:methyl-accepting chemotaxis protein [Marinospirillum alkaliphilum]SFX07375.1 methyl-accepting chemotaxis protein [Marinospirillum alkaliphilum DSM 21637]
MLSLLRQLAIQSRLWLILGLTLLSLVLVGLLAVQQERRAILAEKDLKLQQLLELAHTTLEHHYQRARRGEISEQQARTEAFELIRAFRYTTDTDRDYFWILDGQGTMLMHPEQPELVGRNLAGLKDPNGFAFIADMLAQSRSSQGGNTSYVWNKPGFTNPVGKLARYQTFPQWNLILVNGIYLDTVNALLWRHSLALLTIVLIGAGITAVLILLVASSIKRPLHDMLVRMREIADGDGDLTHRLPLEGRDEIMHINRAFNRFIGKIQELVKEAHQSSLSVSAAAEELSAVTQQSAQTVRQQSQETDQVATAMNEMTATVQEVAGNATQAAGAARTASEQTQRGQGRLKETLQTLSDLDASIENTAVTLERLKEGTENIGAIMEVISNVAEQTNLLALNAAIEAARAGEHGRGFAVVADEVRNLAARTQQSTVEIRDTIDRLVKEAEASFVAMAASRKQAAATVSHARETSAALDEVASAIHHIADMNTQIASAAEQQAAVADEINRNVVNINELSDQTAEGAAHTTQASEELAALAEKLNHQVSQFRT